METKNVTIGVFLLMFIGIIVVLAMLPEISTNTSLMTNRISVLNETIDISGVGRNLTEINVSRQYNVTKHQTDAWKIQDCAITNFVMKNQTNGTLTLTTDYIVGLSYGNFSLKNTAALNTSIGNITYVSYDYCGDGYIPNASGRSMAGLVLVFAALGLLGFVIYYAARQYF